MMKKLVALLILFCITFVFTAYGTSSANSYKHTPTPLTYVKNTNCESHTSNIIETEEGVSIICTSNYVLEPKDNGQFLFSLNECSEECLEGNFDKSLKFVSNGHIYMADFYDYNGNIIATKECNNIVTIDLNYKDTKTHIGKVVLYIEFEEKIFTAEFSRGSK